MLVKELIEKLKELPQDSEVMVSFRWYDSSLDYGRTMYSEPSVSLENDIEYTKEQWEWPNFREWKWVEKTIHKDNVVLLEW